MAEVDVAPTLGSELKVRPQFPNGIPAGVPCADTDGGRMGSNPRAPGSPGGSPGSMISSPFTANEV